MTAIAAGFSDSVLGAQRVFRAVMDALARPGSIVRIAGLPAPPAPMSPAAGAIALALADYDTPLWLDQPLAAAGQVTAWLRFHTGAPITADPARAAFAFLADPARLPALETFALGTPEYPDRSTTLVLQVESFADGGAMRLSGPGIAGSQTFSAKPLALDFAARLAENRALFPRGVDLLLATQDEVAGLPRSVRVTAGG
jgi:alpha-D-ribose 1-methylphosphonate 5-triphosphate synthase subunit PhnH